MIWRFKRDGFPEKQIDMRGGRIFSFCARHRFLLVGITLILLAIGWGASLRIHLTTDVAALLPDRGNHAVAEPVFSPLLWNSGRICCGPKIMI